MIFELRFADCLPWERVAERMGEGHTSERVRQVCSRYLRQQGAARGETVTPVTEHM